ncbi:MAG: hypothetical protein E5Y32_03895 [Mesorhizobium sp.]|nr:MAG: hypothetical protein EOQ95_23060 [Mesorhizobium sp.]TIN48668.1 MAG: hypothetical protein E5Y32_03895 [Mesorhizobium sp.]
MLTVKEAAEYCSIPARRFAADCNVTPLSLPGGERRYDMRDLDVWIDSLKSGDPTGDDELIGKLG